MNKRIRLLVVDNHPVVRSGLRWCLKREDRFTLIGEGADGEEGLAKALELQPDVVLLDMVLPKMNGFELTESLRRERPEVRVLAFSIQGGQDFVCRVARSGAHGYVAKNAPTDVLFRAIEAVAQGQRFFTPEIEQATTKAGKGGGPGHLTPRERKVLMLIAGGRSTKEIAAELGVGMRTVETHRERVMRRLNIRTVAGLTRYAVANGLIGIGNAS